MNIDLVQKEKTEVFNQSACEYIYPAVRIWFNQQQKQNKIFKHLKKIKQVVVNQTVCEYYLYPAVRNGKESFNKKRFKKIK